MKAKEIIICDECGGEFLKGTSKMARVFFTALRMEDVFIAAGTEVKAIISRGIRL